MLAGGGRAARSGDRVGDGRRRRGADIWRKGVSFGMGRVEIRVALWGGSRKARRKGEAVGEWPSVSRWAVNANKVLSVRVGIKLR